MSLELFVRRRQIDQSILSKKGEKYFQNFFPKVFMNFFNFREKMRRSFSHQPAQSLVIDVGYPTTEITVNNISKALQNVLTISHTFRGKSRIPVFGLSVINDRFTVLQELNSLKVSHVSVKKILDNPLSMVSVRNRRLCPFLIREIQLFLKTKIFFVDSYER